MAVDWTPEDSARATAQGWDIFETSRSAESEQSLQANGRPYAHRPFELQRDDEAGIFESDHAAHAFVRERAQQGDALAFKALAFLREKSPKEYSAIISP